MHDDVYDSGDFDEPWAFNRFGKLGFKKLIEKEALVHHIETHPDLSYEVGAGETGELGVYHIARTGASYFFKRGVKKAFVHSINEQRESVDA